MPPDDILIALRALERQTFIRRAEWFEELASTNTFALSSPDQLDRLPPWLVGADRQKAGRGRGNNLWWSSAGGLMFSLVINPVEHGLPLSRCPQVALITGLAVADALEAWLPPSSVQLKWPNDVFADGRKICGILTEVPPGRGDRLVIGIGINVGNSLVEAPAELQKTAVSLCDLLPDSCPHRGELLVRLIPCWEQWFQRLVAEEIDFPKIWQPKCLLHGETVSVTMGERTQTGVCAGLDADGALLLRTNRGIERVLAGTVRTLAGAT